MIVPGQLIPIKFSSKNAKHYRALGYTFKPGDIIYVKPEELMRNSQAKIKVCCDRCKNPQEKIVDNQSYRKAIETQGEYVCEKCHRIRDIEKCRNKLNDKSDREKQDVNQKRINTNIQRYGFDNPAKSDVIKAKTKITNIKRYGGVAPACDDSVKEKIAKTKQDSGNEYVSGPELLLKETLLKLYGNCEHHKSVSFYTLDCVINVNDVQIDVEYDGWYWHKNRQKFDAHRNDLVIRNGYKILRIKSSDNQPTDKQLIEAINKLVTTDDTYAEIILSDWGRN